MTTNIRSGRRGLIRGTAALAVTGVLGVPRAMRGAAAPGSGGRLKQSVARWCYGSFTLDQLAREAAGIGYRGIDLLGPDDWPTIRKYGLVCPLVSVGGAVAIDKGLNRVEHHPAILDALRRAIDLTADAGFPNIVCFAGNRGGLSDEEGLANCAKGLLQLVSQAEKRGVTLCMELLNSKVDHKDYMGDHTTWGATLVRRVGSPRLKLLYDIYHMQIMEGDVIRTIRENLEHIAHFHTGGVPGRHDIDASQELNYTAVCRAIADAGYTGFLAQEFVPSGEPLRALEQAFRSCDV